MTPPGTRRRIAITGAGLLCALGPSRWEAWEGICEGRVGISPVWILQDGRAAGWIAGQVPLPRDSSPPAGGRRRLRRLSRSDLLALHAAREALASAGLMDGEELVPERVADFGVCIGSTTGGMLEVEEAFVRAGATGELGIPTRALLAGPCSQPGTTVARWAGLTGPCLANSTACSSGAQAIALAADLIRRGDAPAMLAGGADGLCRLTLSGFGSLKLLDPAPCRPFDASRQGLSIGEGAGLLLLEDWERAQRRSARILAEFLDYGSSCDAYHQTASDPSGEGAAEAIRVALGRAGLEPTEIDYINAHGTGTALNDPSEVAALRAVFQDRATKIPVSSSKSLFGHALGAAGGLEAVVAVTALETQTLPPTAGWQAGDLGFDLDVVPSRPRRARVRAALSNNFGFGGGNCTLVFAAGRAP